MSGTPLKEPKESGRRRRLLIIFLFPSKLPGSVPWQRVIIGLIFDIYYKETKAVKRQRDVKCVHKLVINNLWHFAAYFSDCAGDLWRSLSHFLECCKMSRLRILIDGIKKHSNLFPRLGNLFHFSFCCSTSLFFFPFSRTILIRLLMYANRREEKRTRKSVLFWSWVTNENLFNGREMLRGERGNGKCQRKISMSEVCFR